MTTNEDLGGLPELPEPSCYSHLSGKPLYSEDKMLEHRGEYAKALLAAELCRAAPAGGDVPFDTVRNVVRALSRLGHSFPEGQEEQAARAVELVNTLCREVQSHFDSLGSAPAVSTTRDGDGEIEKLVQAIMSEPYGDTTLGDMICAEISGDRCRAHIRSALLRKLQQGAGHG